jgi:hypothetical protein
MRRWLARLAFSFIILAAVLAWEGYQSPKSPDGQSATFAYFAGAGVCLVIGLLGIRESIGRSDRMGTYI